MESSCEYIDSVVAGSRYGVVLQLGIPVRFYKQFIVRTYVMKQITRPRALTDALVQHQWKMDKRLGAW
jgi:hypothetical protein